MRAPVRVLLMLLAIVLVIGLAGFGYGFVTVRRPWPQTDGTIQVDNLQAEVTVIRDSWASLTSTLPTPTTSSSLRGMSTPRTVSGRWSSGDGSAPGGWNVGAHAVVGYIAPRSVVWQPPVLGPA